MPNPVTAPAWQRLQALQKQLAGQRLTALFDQNSQRFTHYSAQVGNLFVDYSKNFIDDASLAELLTLADNQQLLPAIQHLANGQRIASSVAAVPYPALRDRSFVPLSVDGDDIASAVRNGLHAMRRVCEEIRSWNWRGYNGKHITDIVTLGVGGSGIGAEMLCRALAPYHSPSLKSHFIANADAQAIRDKLTQLHPDTTLFIVSSKSFTTQETLQNAQLAKNWVTANAGIREALDRHFIAITSNKAAALEFGISPDNILPLWDWLPGRYSLWTSAGLPVALAIGMERFEQMLDGAHLVDRHFQTTPLRHNLPVVLGLLGIWYANFWNTPSHAILPYSELLDLLPGYLQHSLMETNGKSVDLQGNPVTYATAPVIWGSAGTKNQHTYFQWLHQGTHLVPTDFIVVAADTTAARESVTTFLHFLAQTETLLRGVENSDTDGEQQLPGNKPSTSWLLADLSPATMGQLLALYEHIGFVQSVLWNLNPFSHWGIELGKRFSAALGNASIDDIAAGQHDSSTLGLVNVFKRMQDEQHQRDPFHTGAVREESVYSVF